MGSSPWNLADVALCGGWWRRRFEGRGRPHLATENCRGSSSQGIAGTLDEGGIAAAGLLHTRHAGRFQRGGADREQVEVAIDARRFG